MVLFAATIFLSAFLLFLVQPLIARVILPWFGGSAAVWTTCLMFFQVTLLAGYAYAHGLTRLLRPRAQGTVHLVLLFASILALPIFPGQNWKPVDGLAPEWRILVLLGATIGAPYVLLSATGPLLQAWFARRFERSSPYRLYALSNAGSLVALLSYPVLVEPLLRLRAQAYSWSAAYIGFVVLCGIVAYSIRSAAAAAAHAEPEAPSERPNAAAYVFWIGLAFCPSVLLVAVTSHLTQNIAPVPLLWVVPLSLYLLSFILTFESDRWYGRRLWFPLFVFAAGLMLAFLFPNNINTDLKTLIPLFTVGFFICAVVCHGELHRLRPAPRYLTSFYFMVSLGGALGGVFVALAAPVLFRTYLELPIGLLVTVVLIGSVLHHAAPSLPGPLARHVEYALIGALGGGLVFLLAVEEPRWEAGYKVLARNFYGAVRVEDYDETEENSAYRELHHGTINHGSEFMRDDLKRRPTTYYARGSGVGIALGSPDPMRRVGVIGLGAGTLAAYCRPGDVFRFYEINPVVVDIAKSDFYYLRECHGQVDIVLGDARLSLEREEPQQFDILAVDAFSGDSIPVHLLTLEAFREYFRHMKPDGIVAVHVSNKYLRLAPVVTRAAQELKKTAVAITNPEDGASGVYASDWILLSTDPRAFDRAEWHGAQHEPLPEPHRQLWTDDYSNLLKILK